MGGLAGGLFEIFDMVGWLFLSAMIGKNRADRVQLRSHRVVYGGVLTLGAIGIVTGLFFIKAGPPDFYGQLALAGGGGGFTGGILAAILLEYVRALEREEWEREHPRSRSTGCFIATAAFDGQLTPEVFTLKLWRDRTLAKSFVGRKILTIYYFTSPNIARILHRSSLLKRITRKGLEWIAKHIEKNNFL